MSLPLVSLTMQIIGGAPWAGAALTNGLKKANIVLVVTGAGVGLKRGGGAVLAFLSICQAFFQKICRRRRVINRLEVISDVSGFLPCFRVIMLAGSRPLGSPPSY